MTSRQFARAALFGALALLPLSLPLALAADGALGLQEAIDLATERDPWLRGSQLRQRALAEREVAAGSLPDPVASLGAANLPVDSFDIHQEPMTQFKVGLAQMFPRGDSRALDQQRLALLGGRESHLRDDRREQAAVQVAGLWLDAYLARESIRLIRDHRGLFEYLVDVASASYASTAGGTRQQDVIRAQLELTRLDERIAALRQRRDAAGAALAQWLGAPADVAPGEPRLSLRAGGKLRSPGPVDSDWLAGVLLRHPAVRGIEQAVAASDVEVDLARQKYRPQWGISAGYGYRDDDPMGRDRADFFSIGLTFDLPLFTGARQDREVASATATAAAGRTEKSLALRRLRAGFERERARLLRLDERDRLYRERLLAQMNQQAEAALTAYTNDDGDFAEVVRARIDELNARVDALDIRVERLRAIAGLNYYLAGYLDKVDARAPEAS